MRRHFTSALSRPEVEARESPSTLAKFTLPAAPILKRSSNFARANWWHQNAALALGRLYAQSGDAERADAALRLASRLDVHDTEALRLMVEIRLRANKLDDAFQIQRRAVARQPDQPSQYVLLSDILEKMGRNIEARAELAKASYLRSLVQTHTVAN